MAVSLQGAKIGSLVHRFVTSGKPGYCELCHSLVDKLEAHHIKYEPEATIKLCHHCHHRVHFWPKRVNEQEKFKILEKVHPKAKALELSKFKFADISDLAKIIAPSRNIFIHAAQKLDNESIEINESPSLPKTQVQQAILQIKRFTNKSNPRNPVRQLTGFLSQKLRHHQKDINTSEPSHSQQSKRDESRLEKRP